VERIAVFPRLERFGLADTNELEIRLHDILPQTSTFRVVAPAWVRLIPISTFLKLLPTLDEKLPRTCPDFDTFLSTAGSCWQEFISLEVRISARFVVLMKTLGWPLWLTAMSATGRMRCLVEWPRWGAKQPILPSQNSESALSLLLEPILARHHWPDRHLHLGNLGDLVSSEILAQVIAVDIVGLGHGILVMPNPF